MARYAYSETTLRHPCRFSVTHVRKADALDDEGVESSRGYEFARDAMAGNEIPYFSTPDRFDPVTGIA